MADELVQLSMNNMPIQQQSSILHQNHLKLSVVNMNFFLLCFGKFLGSTAGKCYPNNRASQIKED